MRLRSETMRFRVMPFLLGALVLSLLSIPQKLALGSDLLAARGFIIPVLFGGLAGMLLGGFNRRLNREHRKLIKAHRKLQEFAQQYESYFNENHVAILLIDPATAEIVDANPAACAYYGYDKDEITGLKISDINTLPDEVLLKKMQHAVRENRRHFIFKHRLAGGAIRDVEVYSGPIEVKGRQLLYSQIHDITSRIKVETEREELVEQLQDALANIKTLSGLLPICSKCKKIRDDSGYWRQIEEYISQQSEAQFSHGICPECAAELYPGLDLEKVFEKTKKDADKLKQKP